MSYKLRHYLTSTAYTDYCGIMKTTCVFFGKNNQDVISTHWELSRGKRPAVYRYPSIDIQTEIFILYKKSINTYVNYH